MLFRSALLPKSSTEDSLEDFGKSAAQITAGLVAFGFAAKKAFDFTREGAQINQTADSFDLLLEKVKAKIPNAEEVLPTVYLIIDEIFNSINVDELLAALEESKNLSENAEV